MSDLLTHQAFSVARVAADVLDTDTGHYASGAVTNFAIRGSRQPVKGRQLNLLPEADRVKSPQNFFSGFLFVEGDVVTDPLTSRTYFVKGVDDWTQYDLPHSKAMGLLRNDA